MPETVALIANNGRVYAPLPLPIPIRAPKKGYLPPPPPTYGMPGAQAAGTSAGTSHTTSLSAEEIYRHVGPYTSQHYHQSCGMVHNKAEGCTYKPCRLAHICPTHSSHRDPIQSSYPRCPLCDREGLTLEDRKERFQRARGAAPPGGAGGRGKGSGAGGSRRR